MATIAVLGTLDSKGLEHAYVADCIREHGHEAVLIDVGTGEPPQIDPDITREQVAGVGGDSSSGYVQDVSKAFLLTVS